MSFGVNVRVIEKSASDPQTCQVSKLTPNINYLQFCLLMRVVFVNFSTFGAGNHRNHADSGSPKVKAPH